MMAANVATFFLPVGGLPRFFNGGFLDGCGTIAITGTFVSTALVIEASCGLRFSWEAGSAVCYMEEHGITEIKYANLGCWYVQE
jgi:hypothetical protein